MSDVHGEVGSYVTDSLDAAERAAYEEHLSGCAICRAEVAEFDETLVELAGLTATAPPPALRDAVLAGIRGVQPLPPVAEGAAESAAAEDAVPTPRTEPRPAGPEPETAGAPDWDRPVDELAQRRESRRIRILSFAVAATLVAALGLGGWVFSLVQQQQALTARQQVEAADAERQRSLLTAPDARVVSKSQGGAVYSFVYSKQRNEALFLGTNLDDPGAGKTYQLWTVPPGADAAPAPNALVGGYGRTQTWLAGEVGNAAAFAVSVEPATGSTSPTSTPVVVPA